MAEVSAVCMDNGEATLERCVKSLRNQPVKVEVIIVSGPGTNRELAESIADKVIGPYDFIGLGRIEGIKAASSEYVITCDADSIYGENYAVYALNNLMRFNAVKAGTVLPLEPSVEGYVESLFARIIMYEFSLGVRRSAFLNLLKSVPFNALNRRLDIGWHVLLMNPRIDPQMVVWTRLPTYGFRQLSLIAPRLLAIAGAASAAAIPFLVH